MNHFPTPSTYARSPCKGCQQKGPWSVCSSLAWVAMWYCPSTGTKMDSQNVLPEYFQSNALRDFCLKNTPSKADSMSLFHMGTPQIIHLNRFNRVFHYKPSILGDNPYFWKHPYHFQKFWHKTRLPLMSPSQFRHPRETRKGAAFGSKPLSSRICREATPALNRRDIISLDYKYLICTWCKYIHIYLCCCFSCVLINTHETNNTSTC